MLDAESKRFTDELGRCDYATGEMRKNKPPLKLRSHDGCALSGTDPTKMDGSTAYIWRQMAKLVMKSGFCKLAFVQWPWAIGVAKCMSILWRLIARSRAH